MLKGGIVLFQGNVVGIDSDSTGHLWKDAGQTIACPQSKYPSAVHGLGFRV